MVFPVVGGTQSTGYDIDNSVRFNRGDGADLGRAPSADGNRKTWTFSTWVKLGNIPWDKSQDFDIFSANSTNNFRDELRFDANGKLTLLTKVSGDTANGVKGSSTRLFRDSSAWYHIVVALDTTQATNTNGFKMYVNGVQETISFNAYNQNISTSFNKDGSTMSIGHRQNDGGNHYDGYISETNFIDGTQLDASYFGETNDNGVWIPKKYTGSYGTNGFFFEYQQTGTSQNSSGIGADTSGNDNHFAVTNLAAIDVTVDTPTNNFATLNPLAVGANTNKAYSEGNTKVLASGGSGQPWKHALGTIGVSNGKWYWECKAIISGIVIAGVTDADTTSSYEDDALDEGVYYRSSNGYKYVGGSDSSYGNTFANDDIIGVALDMDNKKIYFSKNGTFQNSGDPTSGSTGTGALSVSSFSTLLPDVIQGDGSDGWQLNFGNAPFAISSGNADANGYGEFEYAVPSGYYSLCTKNLAEYG